MIVPLTEGGSSSKTVYYPMTLFSLLPISAHQPSERLTLGTGKVTPNKVLLISLITLNGF